MTSMNHGFSKEEIDFGPMGDKAHATEVIKKVGRPHPRGNL